MKQKPLQEAQQIRTQRAFLKQAVLAEQKVQMKAIHLVIHVHKRVRLRLLNLTQVQLLQRKPIRTRLHSPKLKQMVEHWV